MHIKAKNNPDPNQLSGVADVKSTEDNHGKFSGTGYIIISGTLAPSGTAFQVVSGLPTANVPNTQITSVINSVYVTPSNQNRAPIQNSGSANVPTSESSITH